MRILLLSLLSAFLLIACIQEETVEEIYKGPEADKAVAVIHPTEGNDISGVVIFTQTDEGVRVEATVSGLPAESLHGFHIHEYGDCRASDATSAGGHFNPTDMPHGGPTDTERHLGDLGNLPTDEDGVATIDFVDEQISLRGEHSIIGYAVIVHEDRDDLVSQPVGDAGPRKGCGVIGVANPDY
jgi:superoxide dismutase, Cu-Zn family